MITAQLPAPALAASHETEADQSSARAASPGTSPIRVLHVINGEHYSGAERVQDLLALHLPRFGYELSFACVKPGQFASRRMARTADVFDVPMRSRFDLRGVRDLRRLIREHDFRIVHAHTPRSALIGRLAAAWARVPMVYHVHSPTSRDTTHRWRNRINQAVEKLSLLRVRGLIAVSRSLGQHMHQQGFRDRQVTVVPNGVPAPNLTRSTALPSGEWTIGTVALFRPRKGLEILLDAISDLHRRGLSCRLRAVGPFETPEYESEIRERVHRLGLADHIDWVGFTSDVFVELAGMDLFVLPSLFGEGLPMVVLEAMAAGVPVVGTRIEGVPEAIEHGVSGLIAESSDAADLARCIRQVMAGEINWLGLRDQAMARHSEQFSAVRMAQGVAAVYDGILK